MTISTNMKRAQILPHINWAVASLHALWFDIISHYQDEKQCFNFIITIKASAPESSLTHSQWVVWWEIWPSDGSIISWLRDNRVIKRRDFWNDKRLLDDFSKRFPFYPEVEHGAWQKAMCHTIYAHISAKVKSINLPSIIYLNLIMSCNPICVSEVESPGGCFPKWYIWNCNVKASDMKN